MVLVVSVCRFCRFVQLCKFFLCETLSRKRNIPLSCYVLVFDKIPTHAVLYLVPFCRQSVLTIFQIGLAELKARLNRQSEEDRLTSRQEILRNPSLCWRTTQQISVQMLEQPKKRTGCSFSNLTHLLNEFNRVYRIL